MLSTMANAEHLPNNDITTLTPHVIPSEAEGSLYNKEIATPRQGDGSQ